MMNRFLIILFLLLTVPKVWSNSPFTIARIHYQGGGDWYGNRTTFVNLFQYIRQNTNIEVSDKETSVKIMDAELFKYPVVYIAGHGNIRFSDEEVQRFRKYLTSGGFLWADDDYGMDPAFRREMKKVFPDADWIELPFSHSIYHVNFQFPNGLPKVHKHDGGPPKGLGLFFEGEMVAFYSLNTDISDGCEDPDIHEDPRHVREEALKMATNIVVWALTH